MRFLDANVFIYAYYKPKRELTEKQKPMKERSKEIWYFEHPLPEGYKKYNKTKPICIEEFDLEKAWWEKREENECAWKVSIEEIKKRNYNLDIKNLLGNETEKKKNVEQILNDISERNFQIQVL